MCVCAKRFVCLYLWVTVENERVWKEIVFMGERGGRGRVCVRVHIYGVCEMKRPFSIKFNQ